MRNEVRWERMFPDELEHACRRFPVVYLPYGLCEPHGPHNALGMDALRAHSASCLAAETHGGIVAPPFYWNIHELGGYGSWAEEMIGDRRPWLTAYPPWMFFKSILYHVRTMDMLEMKGALLFTGHSGPHAKDMRRFIERLQRHVTVRVDYLIGLANESELFDDGLGDGGHAGRGETSLLWATDTDCVDMSRLPDGDEPGLRFAMGKYNDLSDRRAGERGVAEIVKILGERASALVEAYDEAERVHRPLSFGELEEIWHDEFLPDLAGYTCMNDVRIEPPEGSRWRRNWPVGKVYG